jgi:hypothetical protein
MSNKKGQLVEIAATRVHPGGGGADAKDDAGAAGGGAKSPANRRPSALEHLDDKDAQGRQLLAVLRTAELLKHRFNDTKLQKGMLVEYTPNPSKSSHKLLCQVLGINDGEPATCSLRHCKGSAGKVYERVLEEQPVEVLQKGPDGLHVVVTVTQCVVVEYERLQPETEVLVFVENWPPRGSDDASPCPVDPWKGEDEEEDDDEDDDTGGGGSGSGGGRRRNGGWFNAKVKSFTNDQGHGVYYTMVLGSNPGVNPGVEIERVAYECIRAKPWPQHQKRDHLEVMLRATEEGGQPGSFDTCVRACVSRAATLHALRP